VRHDASAMREAATEESPRVTVESADGGRWTGVFELRDSAERICSLELTYGDRRFQADGPDYFDALCRIREQLAVVGHTLHCYGASRNVFPSGMARDMGAGLKAYRLQMGRSSDLADLVSIFASGPDVEPVSVADQEAFYDAWLRSFRG
jgi:hypothetical protein